MTSEHEPGQAPTAVAFASGAQALRRMALDEQLKARVMGDPVLARVARRVAERYVAGETLAEALDRVRLVVADGHAASLELVGESVRDRSPADEATDEFVEAAEQIGRSALPCTVSLDLSHVGLLVDRGLAVANATRVAHAAAAAGTWLMISAEGSDRTDQVLDVYDAVSAVVPEVGITLQARLRRTPDDLERVTARPGTVRLVKGAFEEPAVVALPRESPDLRVRYLDLAERLVRSGHRTSIATHDQNVLAGLSARLGPALREQHVEFEMLLGLGGDGLERLRSAGSRTREYVVYGQEWWLYVLNRVSEQPDRLHTAVVDAFARG